MTDSQPPILFRDSKPLSFRDINADISNGERLIELSSIAQHGDSREEIYLDVAEAIALRNWLNEVIP